MPSSGSSIVMSVNPIAYGGKGGSFPSWMMFAVAMGIGYLVGSLFPWSLSSVGTAAWRGLLFIEEWVRDVVVPCYTLSALSYLLIQNYNDPNGSLFFFKSKGSEKETETLAEPTDDDDDDDDDGGEKPIDMNGTYKVVENDNFGEFLQAQGLPWFLCNAASKARPTHEFTHSSLKKLTIKIRGIIESETSYQINGPHTVTTIRGRAFHDSLSYLYDLSSNVCVGVQTRKVAMGEGYVVEVERRVIRAGSVWNPSPDENPDGHCIYDLDTACDFDRLIMTNKIVYDGEKEPVIASQLFHRMD